MARVIVRSRCRSGILDSDNSFRISVGMPCGGKIRNEPMTVNFFVFPSLADTVNPSVLRADDDRSIRDTRSGIEIEIVIEQPDRFTRIFIKTPQSSVPDRDEHASIGDRSRRPYPVIEVPLPDKRPVLHVQCIKPAVGAADVESIFIGIDCGRRPHSPCQRHVPY